MEFRRRDGQSKRQFYRRMAESKKQQWMREHTQQDEEVFKSHFIIKQDDETSHDSNKSKKIVKGEYKSQMRLRNRIAAQQSRQRHRYYVQELQRKVKLYEQLLNKQISLCSNCKRNIQDTQQCESIAEQSSVDSSPNLQPPHQGVSQEQFLNSLLQEQTIRIDNNAATTPFGIFFIVCLVAVLAIFSFNTNQEAMAPRLLTNYYSTLDRLIHTQEDLLHQAAIRQHQQSSKLLQSFIPTHGGHSTIKSIEAQLGETQRSVTVKVGNETWKQYGKFVCSEPEHFINKKGSKQKHNPQFLLLRTGRNSTKTQTNRQTQDEKDREEYQILANQGQRLQISSCFVSDM